MNLDTLMQIGIDAAAAFVVVNVVNAIRQGWLWPWLGKWLKAPRFKRDRQARVIGLAWWASVAVSAAFALRSSGGWWDWRTFLGEWGSRAIMSWLLSRVMGQYVPDTQCGYRLFQASVIPFIGARAERFAAESEVLLQAAARGIRIDSVRIATRYGDERSKVRPLPDTIRFFRMLQRHRRELRDRQVRPAAQMPGSL